MDRCHPASSGLPWLAIFGDSPSHYKMLLYMLSSSARLLRAALFIVFCFLPFSGHAQQVDSNLYSGLRWRMIGPFRGGRTVAVSGIEGQPNVYYFGAVGGGVWKTTNGGLTWEPIFDGQPIGSIGALAIAPSDPNILYAGSGEPDLRSDLTYGNGVYKSTDGGKSWSNIGLRDSQHIARIVVDPRNPNKVLVAALGHAYGPNAERGIFRSTDGGRAWQKVLFKDDNIGAIDIALDPDNSQTVYASLWSVHRPPWSAYPPINGSGAIYRSTDGGVTWTQVTGGGLPEGDWGRIGLAIARGTHGQRIYALIDTRKGGLFRSDDGGHNWTLVGTDQRVRSRGWYFTEVIVDPKDPNTIYLPNVCIYRSTDGGKTFAAIKGAPGGDDYHALWIDPTNPQRMIFGSDQGAGISVDGGKSWSSWYNQPTAQFYHVAVDNQFPYRVYGAQQDSGTVATTSRGDYGAITFRDWHPIGAGESGYIVPDPVDPNIVYGGSTFGSLYRYDERTGQSQDISPSAISSFGNIARAKYRFTWTSPLAFSAQEPHVLYFGSQFLLRSKDRGMSWEKISPDLTGSQEGASSTSATTVANAKAKGYGVIYTIAPSPVSTTEIWVGTDTGLVHITQDEGKTWSNVTPSGLADWSKISILDASHFDAATAYAAIDRHRLDDLDAYIYRTHDYGKTWSKITNGIPNGAYVRAVREDPVRKGLLFAGTELGVYFSLNDGDSWQPLQLNLPVSPVHDLVVKNNDLVVATHGRSFWILDDITPLRQIDSEVAGSRVHLFKPATAMRIRANVNHDTPLSPEVSAGENPPTGAVIYYYLKSPTQGGVSLEVLDSSGQVIRRYSSSDRPKPPVTPPSIASYWFKSPASLSTEVGMHRFVWDLRHTPPPVLSPEYSMATAFGQNTPTEPEGAQVLPGSYQVRLTAAGQTATQTVDVIMDPRLHASREELEKQLALEIKITHAIEQDYQAIQEIRALGPRGNSDLAKKAASLLGDPEGEERPSRQQPTLVELNSALSHLAVVVDSADAAPTAQATSAAEEVLNQLKSLLEQWATLKNSPR
jgi:photosystem II stability/assembly factor-like uncharacterized protein